MKILEFPTARQTYNYDCGAKAMHAVLTYYGIDTNENKILQIAKTTPKRGTPVHGMIRVAQHFKLKARIEELSIPKLKKYIDREIPVILLLQAWGGQVADLKRDWKDGHYVVAIGYDKERIYFEDPSSILRLYISYQDLEERWHDIDKAKKYLQTGIVVSAPKKDFSSVLNTYVSYREQEQRWREIDATPKKHLKTGILISSSRKKISP